MKKLIFLFAILSYVFAPLIVQSQLREIGVPSVQTTKVVSDSLALALLKTAARDSANAAITANTTLLPKTSVRDSANAAITADITKLNVSAYAESLNAYGLYSTGYRSKFTLRPFVGGSDTVLVVRDSAGHTKAFIDTLGKAFLDSIKVAGSAYFATTSGSVGIGTTGPSDKLHVVGGNLRLSGGTGILIADDSGNPFLRLALDIGNRYEAMIVNNWDASTNPGITVGTTRTDGDAFNVVTDVTLTSGVPTGAGTQAFTVKGSGNVGIGTISPVTNSLTLGTSATQRDLW